ncbi:MAG: MBL fold metallo-hydrolase [Pigmentiphaga sp.]
MIVRLLLLLSVIGGLAGCKPTNPYYDPAKPHHHEAGFVNPRSSNEAPSWRDHLALWSHVFSNTDPSPKTPLEALPIDAELLKSHSAGVRVTWIGHATLLIQAGGFNLLTDPHFSDRAWPRWLGGPLRWHRPGIAVEDLPPIHAVVISHNHYENLDLATIRQLTRQQAGPPVFLLPLGVDVWFRLNVPEATELRVLDWEGEAALAGVEFRLVPVKHSSGRGLFDHNQTLWGGWVVDFKQPDFRLFFAGDMAYSADVLQFGERYGPFDLAALPIGGYQPRWRMRAERMNPTEAVQIFRRLDAAYGLGIAWGTFPVTDHRLDEPLIALERAKQYASVPDDIFFTLRQGETRLWKNKAWHPFP